MEKWVSFKELRSRLSFSAVLEHYGVELTVKGEQAEGFCPLPTHASKQRSPSFSANLDRGIWQCFGCGESGNVLDFAVRMEGKVPNNAADVRAVALGLQEWLNLKDVSGAGSPLRSQSVPRKQKPSRNLPRLDTSASRPTLPASKVRINAPLDFRLKDLDSSHPYLLSRGFTAQTIWRFGLGYCSRGLMAGRVAIPLHDENSRLVGYAGRLVDDSRISKDCPKYKLPSRREHEGVIHEFHKSYMLYNAHKMKEPVDHLVVVQGFPSVWWLDQTGITNVVAAMGSSFSKEQAAVVLAKTISSAHVTVIPDGDDAGKRFRQSVFEVVGSRRWVQWISLPDGKQPTDCPPSQLTEVPRA